MSTANNTKKKQKKKRSAPRADLETEEEKKQTNLTNKIDTVIKVTEAFRNSQTFFVIIRWKNVEQLHVHRVNEFCNCYHLDALIHQCLKKKDPQFTNSLLLTRNYSPLISVKPAEESQAIDIDFSIDNPPARNNHETSYCQGHSPCCRKIEDYLDPMIYKKF